MRYIITLIAATFFFCQSSLAQDKNKTTYPLVMSFQSQCCGVPSDSAVRVFIRSFKKQYKIKKITAYHIGPLGREGEYDLAFKLKELNKKQAANFIKKIKQTKKSATEPGLWSFEEKKEIDLSTLPGRTKITTEIF